jgi:hypothetical protein
MSRQRLGLRQSSAAFQNLAGVRELAGGSGTRGLMRAIRCKLYGTIIVLKRLDPTQSAPNDEMDE